MLNKAPILEEDVSTGKKRESTTSGLWEQIFSLTKRGFCLDARK